MFVGVPVAGEWNLWRWCLAGEPVLRREEAEDEEKGSPVTKRKNKFNYIFCCCYITHKITPHPTAPLCAAAPP